jgi:hypothetical protein
MAPPGSPTNLRTVSSSTVTARWSSLALRRQTLGTFLTYPRIVRSPCGISSFPAASLISKPCRGNRDCVPLLPTNLLDDNKRSPTYSVNRIASSTISLVQKDPAPGAALLAALVDAFRSALCAGATISKAFVGAPVLFDVTRNRSSTTPASAAQQAVEADGRASSRASPPPSRPW